MPHARQWLETIHTRLSISCSNSYTITIKLQPVNGILNNLPNCVSNLYFSFYYFGRFLPPLRKALLCSARSTNKYFSGAIEAYCGGAPALKRLKANREVSAPRLLAYVIHWFLAFIKSGSVHFSRLVSRYKTMHLDMVTHLLSLCTWWNGLQKKYGESKEAKDSSSSTYLSLLW